MAVFFQKMGGGDALLRQLVWAGDYDDDVIGCDVIIGFERERGSRRLSIRRKRFGFRTRVGVVQP